jgi:hypothetical protein
MDIKSITKIVTDPFTNEEQKKRLIVNTLAKDDNILSDILSILHEERTLKKELLTDMNLELSRAHIFIDSFMPPVPKLKNGEKGEDFSKFFNDGIQNHNLKNIVFETTAQDSRQVDGIKKVFEYLMTKYPNKILNIYVKTYESQKELFKTKLKNINITFLHTNI